MKHSKPPKGQKKKKVIVFEVTCGGDIIACDIINAFLKCTSKVRIKAQHEKPKWIVKSAYRTEINKLMQNSIW